MTDPQTYLANATYKLLVDAIVHAAALHHDTLAASWKRSVRWAASGPLA